MAKVNKEVLTDNTTKQIIPEKKAKVKISENSKKSVLTDSPVKTLSENSIVESDTVSEEETSEIDIQKIDIEIDDVNEYFNKSVVNNQKNEESIFNELPMGNLMGGFKISEIEEDIENPKKVIEEIKPVRRIRHDGGIHF